MHLLTHAPGSVPHLPVFLIPFLCLFPCQDGGSGGGGYFGGGGGGYNSGGGGGSGFAGHHRCCVPDDRKPFDTKLTTGANEQPQMRDGQRNDANNFWDLKGEGKIFYRYKEK